MIIQALQILTVNLHRRNPLVHSLLQTCSADIVFIQEPWVGAVHTAQSDSDPLGVTIPGAVHNNMWHAFLPKAFATDTCKVVAYVRERLLSSILVTNLLDHPLASPSCLILDFAYEEDHFQVICFYHVVPNKGHALSPLMSFSLDDLTPAIVLGNFNTHSRLWSPLNVSPSPWAPSFEDWLESNGLNLLNEPTVPTWRGRHDQKESTIDLVLINEAASTHLALSPLSVSFTDSLGSDHAALSFSWTPSSALPPVPRSLLPGFKLEDGLQQNWMVGFRCKPHPIITDIDSLVSAAAQLHKDIDAVSAELFDRRHTPDPQGVNWWDSMCSTAVTIVRNTPHGPERRQASRALTATVAQAKRAWAQAALDGSNGHDLWSVARWRHGRRISHIPPLKIDGTLCHEPERMADAFRERFFSSAPTNISPSQPDDPPTHPERPYHPVTEEEIQLALASTSNKSAPGLSGINYKLLKWVFAAAPHHLTSLFDACLHLVHHPWHDALVVVIPKPNKPDYAVPKAYRPISLLECCAKLVEKIVARCFLSNINLFDLLPRTQFGSRDYSSPVDAILAVTHKAETVIKSKLVGALILFDIQSLKKLSQCFAILERLTWNKSSKLSNIMKIIYVILHHLSFWKCHGSCDLDQK